MLRTVWLLLVVGAAVGGANLQVEDDHGDGNLEAEWTSIEANEIAPATDLKELDERFRNSLNLLKRNEKLELVILIDTSASVGEENFKSELKFVQKLVAHFNVGPSHARVAVVGFASSAKTYVNNLVEEASEKCSLVDVDPPKTEFRGSTNTVAALQEARQIFKNSRDGAQKALFVVTDGFSNKGDPVPIANELKDSGIVIFTFSIQTGNVREVREMSSAPAKNHSFILESFSEFKALTRRALHEDLPSGSYVPLNDTTLCDDLCPANSSSETGCCNGQARCSCGVLTGQFACLCPPGFYGSGLAGEECLPCPIGTYHDGSYPGDMLACIPCPDENHVTVKVPAVSESDCVCREGYVAVDGKCEVTTCPVLTAPTNGYFVNKNCSNVVNAACGVGCSTGYRLHGSSVRICQLNGNWSGKPPSCQAKSCGKPKPVRDSTVECKNEDYGLESVIRYDSEGNLIESLVSRIGGADEEAVAEFNYTVDTVCAFKCGPGHTMVGSRVRTCLPILMWNGLSTTCTVNNCPSLSVIKDGSISPENCTAKGLRHAFAAECSVTCRDGYRLDGPSVRNCTGRRGTWSGRHFPNKCIDVEPPVFTCPENQTVDTAQEESYALVLLSLPEGTDNSGADPIIWSKPPFLPEYPLPLKIGVTKIEIYATDASDNGDSCEFFIEVQDKETPKIYNCESPPTFYMSDLDAGDLEVNWTEPIFTDNSDTPLTIERSREFGRFPVGTTPVVYTVTDASGNAANCTMNVTVAENPCSDRPTLGNVEWNCTTEGRTMTCALSCPSGLTWTTNSDLTNVTFTCQYDRNGAKWFPDVFSDLDAVPECSAFEVPTEVVESHEIELDEKEVNCDDLESLFREVSNEINILIGSDEAAQISIVADCLEEDPKNNTLSESEKSNDIPARRRRRSSSSSSSSTGRKRIKVHISITGTSNKTSSEDVVRHLQELGQKVEEQYGKNAFINVGGRKVKVQGTKIVNSARLKCRAGFVLKRGLCVKCPPGTFFDGTKSSCTPCPIGQYQSFAGQTRCESCPAGFLTRRRRRKQLKECKEICPAGTFGKIKNKQQKLAVKPCSPCPVGSYQPSQGQTSCLQCPEERTTTKKGSSQAEQCVERQAIEDPCYRFPCKNNGTCFMYNGYPYCLCPEGYLGSFCERERNHCDSSPCYNDAECIPIGVTSFTCKCPSGYEGDLCQLEVNECSSDPCANGAECIDLVNAYKCECLPGYAGTHCEEDINECEVLNNPCQNNGTCNDLVNDYSCTCPEGFGGKHCEETSLCQADDTVDEHCNPKVIQVPQEVNPCAGVVCPANMECTVAGGIRNLPLCRCRKGFNGPDCSQELNLNVILTFPKRSVTEYMAVNFPLEDIPAISVCFWIQAEDLRGYDTLFSYAVRENDNAFTITDNKGFVLYVNKERVVTDIVANDGHWHFLCVTWESKGGQWEIYFDGKRKANGTGLSAGRTIPGGGRFIIGQEQDRFGGGFSEVESFVGRLTHFDIWKRVVKKSEVEGMNENCRRYEGDMFSWKQFLDNMHGNIQISNSTFCANCDVGELQMFRGSIRVQNVGESMYGVYECKKGFRIRFDDTEADFHGNSSVWYRKCLKHGNWEPSVPKCSRVRCGFPGYFPHGVMRGDSYLFSDVVEYRCSSGYTLVGNSTRECLENGTWSGVQPTCKGNSGHCEEIVAPRHGSMFIYFGGKRKLYFSAIGDRAEFVCDEGYRLRGSPVLTCTEEGLWDDVVPVCEQTSCAFPTDMFQYLVNFTLAQSFAVGEVLIVKCSETEDTQAIECLQNGGWNYTVGLCGGKCKGRPSHPENGLLLGDPLRFIYSAGEVIHARCRYGYRLSGDDFFTCSGNGTWYQEKETICQPVDCGRPIPPPNAYVPSTTKSYPYGIRILFRCLPGFIQIGDLLTRCEGEGRWSKIFGRCIGIVCGPPIVSDGVKFSGSSYTFGDRVKFECANGGKPTTEDATCLSDGTWSQLPRCL